MPARDTAKPRMYLSTLIIVHQKWITAAMSGNSSVDVWIASSDYKLGIGVIMGRFH